MNYLAHAYQHLDDPYFAAGTGLPDWMNVIDRKNRARRPYAAAIAEHPDPRVASFARGCVRHHDDDRWFHQCDAFVNLSTQFAVELRGLLEQGLGHQAGFVGHISVELLLDSIVAERYPWTLEEYYAVLRSVDKELVQAAASEICRKPVQRLVELLTRFIEARFLADYRDNALLLRSLNGVMRRVDLPLLPDGVADWLATARIRVRKRADELLTPQHATPLRIFSNQIL